MLNDIRVGLRLLWKNSTFTLTVALTLALCIGANTALFSVVHHVLLRPLPFPESERVVLMANQYPGASVDVSTNSGVPDYYDRLREMTVYDEQAMYNWASVGMDLNGSPTRVQGMNVTPSFFRLVRVPPALGHIFSEADGEVGNDKKIVLSYGFWQSAFGGDPKAIGRDVRLDGQAYTIVGVMPRDFTFISARVMLWRVLAFAKEQRADSRRHSNNWTNIARLKAGATVQQAQAEVDALNARNLERFPQYKQILQNARFHTTIQPLHDTLVREVRATLFLLWGGALFLLLIGCVNVANLVLVWSRGRMKELATRLAIGAGRLRIARQLVIEGILLTMASAVGGVVCGYALLQGLSRLQFERLPRGHEIGLDGTALLVVLAITAVIGLLLGLIPVMTVLPTNLTTVLREEGRSGTAGSGARALRRALVVLQVAFAFVLLVGAGLLLSSFRHVLAVDPGFNPHGVLTANVGLPRARYTDTAAVTVFSTEAFRRLRALPGVTHLGSTDTIPFGGTHNDSVIIAEGYQMKPGESLISPNQVQVSPGYFEAIGARIVRGRFFDDRDAVNPPRTIVVDEKLARRFWPDQDPIGRRLYMPSDINNLTAVSKDTIFMTVVGVVRDITLADLVQGSGQVGAYYFPTATTSRGATFAIRTATDPHLLAKPVRDALNSLDRELPVFDVQTLEERMDTSMVDRRVPMLLSLGFSGVALFLAAIGVYGVLAYGVTQRTKEIGIRIALGSTAGAVFDLVLREGLWLVAGGLLLGGAGAVALRKSLESQLFGVKATDPIVIASVVAVLALVSLAACAVPARRATKIDPIIALGQ